MVFKCIGCGFEWGEGNPEVEGYSHGSCKACLKKALIPIYRKRQKEQFFHDCFGRSEDYCSRVACSYYRWCCCCIHENA